MDKSHVNRIEGLFYSKSDEKFTVRALLDEVLGNRRFERALDVGPGAGYISEPLAGRSKQLTMVEKDAKYADPLSRQFENAQIIIGDIRDVELTGPFDVILLSHLLYYLPEAQWLSLIERLHALLRVGGELLLVLNSDSGDWWKVINHYAGERLGFNYIPLTQLRKELAAIGSVQIHPYRYQMWIEPGVAWSEFIGTQILELADEKVRQQYEPSFQELAKSFQLVDGNIVLDFRAEILRVKA